MTNESRVDNTTPRYRMESGFDVLEDWSPTASQSKRNAVYKALFAMQDGSMFRTYRVIDDFQRANEVFVIVKDDLVMKIRVKCVDAFDIVAIGPCGHMTDLHTGRWQAT
ncbi:DUF6235 family protein [Actinophytocola oryzae]|uniref:Uncharacterized protein n=1 Tax=Actinophytocola oryzae TaxID=502181 RepID=A0A4R7V0Z2_9PSEU|nr:DUF6235 family protein [Actinophytocola oryzae]TDV41076.1 hypothetical protein CLV71_121142 [Actinophytocola oryzae]